MVGLISRQKRKLGKYSSKLGNFHGRDAPFDVVPPFGIDQEDFLYLKTLAEEVVPLEDRYFPADKRAAIERQILQELGQTCQNRHRLLNNAWLEGDSFDLRVLDTKGSL